MLTVQAWSAEVEGLSGIGFIFNNDVPGFSRTDIIGGIARSLAVLAADALVEIDDHTPMVIIDIFMFGVFTAQLSLFEGSKRGEWPCGNELCKDGRTCGDSCDETEIAPV
jgi:hypothetical protein